jgi:hypothetical protein
MNVVTVATGDLLKIAARAGEIVGSYGHARTMPERVSAMTRAELVAAHVMQELESFTRFVYLRDPQGRLLHVLPDGQFAPRVHTPWRGTSTLTRAQRDRVRAWLLRQADNRLKPPFLYGEDTRRWYLDVKRYPELGEALVWLDRHRLTAGEWLSLIP